MQRYLPRHRPPLEFRPRAERPGRGLRVRWLGAAGHVVQTETTTVLLDPFLTRPGLLRTASARLKPTPERWWRWLPERVDAICCGHSHYDHLLDAPEIARRTGALLLGSRTTASFARAHGLRPAQIVEVPPEGLTRRVGDVEIRFVPSRHGRIVAGRVPFPGEVERPPMLPARVFHYRMGGAYGVHLTTPFGCLYHNGSADLIDAELTELRADTILVGLAGRRSTPDYLGRLLRLLRPRLVVPTHHDLFFAPLETGVRLLPGVALDRFVAEVGGAGRVVMPTYEDVLTIPAGDPRDATFAPL